MRLFNQAVLAAGLAVFSLTFAVRADSTSSAGGKQVFGINFEAGHPLVYSVSMKSKTLTERNMETQAGNNQTSLTKKNSELRYRVRLTPVQKSKSGVWTVHYEPLDFEQDDDFFGNNTHVVTVLRGSDVKTTQNGIVVVDTTKNIGLNQAKTYKQGVYPKMLSGDLDFAPDGSVVKVGGDVPFVDTWTDALKLQVGFFDIIFPSDAVPTGGTWQKNLLLKNLEGLALGDDGIVETNDFVREYDVVTSSNRLAAFSLTMQTNVKNIAGSIEQMGQSTMINLPEFNHNKTGKFQYDFARGCLAGGQENETGKISMEMLVQGHTVSLSIDLENSVEFQLLSGPP
jgi:hypothetical protein